MQKYTISKASFNLLMEQINFTFYSFKIRIAVPEILFGTENGTRTPSALYIDCSQILNRHTRAYLKYVLGIPLTFSSMSQVYLNMPRAYLSYISTLTQTSKCLLSHEIISLHSIPLFFMDTEILAAVILKHKNCSDIFQI